MKDWIVALKAEIVELRAALDQVKSVEVPTAAQRGYCGEDRTVGRVPTVTYP